MANTKNALNVIKKFSEQLCNQNRYSAVLKKVVLISAEETGGHRTVSGELRVQQEHCNPFGTLHGGLIATIVDNFTTYTVLSDPDRIPGVSVDLHVSYLKGAKIGDDVVIEAKSLKLGNKISFMGCELKNKYDGTVYVKGYQSFFMNSK